MRHLKSFFPKTLPLLFILFGITCYGQDNSCLIGIGDYVNGILQDQQGNYWFATHGFGAAVYDGETFDYYSTKEGMSGANVRDMAMDQEGNIWFATAGGITKYEQGAFTNYTEAEGLISNDVYSITIDRKGIIWLGTLEGVNRFDGNRFTQVKLPEAKLDYGQGIRSKKIVRDIIEDSQGNMWLGTNAGAFIYSPSGSLRNLSEKDGLCSNAIKAMLEDQTGNIWFATRTGGLSRYNPQSKSFRNFTITGDVKGKETWSIHEDQAGNIWFSSVGHGMYRFDPATQAFTNFHEEEGLASHALKCIYEDESGRIWAGGWKGVYRYDGKSFSQITQNGPW